MSLDKNTFTQAMRELGLLPGEARLVVAVSGGVDSVVLLSLLHSTGYSAIVAHVNYGLRGAESEDDEKFVRDLCVRLNYECLVLKINPDEAFGEDKTSIQEIARAIRYNWFDEILVEKSAHGLLIAHHRNDQTETIIHQFVRGGALKSLTGMSSHTGKIYRPLLRFSREEVLFYASTNELTWRTDSSNFTSDYTRNLIRHELLPVMEKINPGIHGTFEFRAEILSESQTIIHQRLEEDMKEMITTTESGEFLKLQKFSNCTHPRLLLWHWLESAGFSSAQMEEVLQLVKSQSGKRIDSGSHNLWKEPDALALTTKEGFDEVWIALNDFVVELKELGLAVSLIKRESVIFDPTNQTQYLDADKLKLPLILRTWQQGDVFAPLGMKTRKKISDFLIHEKIPLRRKSKTLVLESDDEIAAVIGLRISENYKISEHTVNVLRITTIQP